MATLPAAHGRQPQLIAMYPAGVTSDGFAQHKLTRLLELRAVIDALRGEPEAREHPRQTRLYDRERAKNS